MVHGRRLHLVIPMLRNTLLSDSFADDNRGITWTIEAVLSTMMLLGILMFTLSTFPAPDVGAQQQAVHQSQLSQDGQDTLQGLEQTNNLSRGLLYVDATETTENDPVFHGPGVSPQGDYGELPDNHPYSNAFELLDKDGVLYNMEVIYQNESNDVVDDPVSVIYRGVPGSNSVIVEYTVILDNSDVLLNSDGSALQHSQCDDIGGSGDVNLSEAANSDDCNYFMPKPFDSDTTNRYNIVRIRLTLWS